MVGAGYFKGGIDLIVPQDQVQTFYPAQLGISEGSVFALYRDRGGAIWLGDGWNIFRSAHQALGYTERPGAQQHDALRALDVTYA